MVYKKVLYGFRVTHLYNAWPKHLLLVLHNMQAQELRAKTHESI